MDADGSLFVDGDVPDGLDDANAPDANLTDVSLTDAAVTDSYVPDSYIPDSYVPCTNFADPVVDLALFKPAASDEITLTGYEPSKANDGDDTTRWKGSDSGSQHWWHVDLGTDHLLTSLTTRWEYNLVNYQYIVSISSNGTSFSTAINKSADPRTTQTRMDTFPGGTCARFVRILKTNTGYTAGLYTVNVMGQ